VVMTKKMAQARHLPEVDWAEKKPANREGVQVLAPSRKA
jgi:hypothetical protein